MVAAGVRVGFIVTDGVGAEVARVVAMCQICFAGLFRLGVQPVAVLMGVCLGCTETIRISMEGLDEVKDRLDLSLQLPVVFFQSSVVFFQLPYFLSPHGPRVLRCDSRGYF